jgi:hypothetical protein
LQQIRVVRQPRENVCLSTVLLENHRIVIAKRLNDPFRQFLAGLAFELDALAP